MSQPLPSSRNSMYTSISILKGHVGPITCMSATDDGKLASGGADGVRLWCLESGKEFVRPSGAGQRGHTSVLTWIRREDEPDDGLVYGTGNGFLVCWKEVASQGRDIGTFEESYCAQVAMPGEITGLSFDVGSNRLAVCNRNSVVQVFVVDLMMNLHQVFSVVIDNHVPKGIAFGQMSGEHKDVLTFGLHDGHIHTLRGTDGAVQHTRNTGCKIGNAVVNSRRGVCCIDDPAQGVALYRLDSGVRVRTYPVTAKSSSKPRQVAFAEDCSLILSASDHGVVYVFDRRSSQIVDELDLGGGQVHSITAAELDNSPVILTAMPCQSRESNNIVLWRKNIDKGAGQKSDEVSLTSRSNFQAMLEV